MHQKRGQATIFIIIGLVIVFSAILIYYLSTRYTPVQRSEALLRETPEEVKAIRLYVDDCLNIVGKQAVINLGEHGGWIYDESDPELIQKPFNVDYNPTESEGVQMSRAGLKIPYWYYMKSKNDCKTCQFSISNVPTRATMKAGLDKYVEKKLGTCLKDFTPLLAEGFEIQKPAEFTVDTKITPDGVIIDLQYVLGIKKNEKEYRLTDFTTVLPVKLGRVYDLATIIVNSEQRDGILEYATMMLVASYATIDKDYLPPLTGATIGPEKIFWSKTEASNKLRDLLAQHTMMITIPKTHNFYPAVIDTFENAYKVKQGMNMGYSSLNIIPENENYQDVDANFYYLNWPIYFDILPSDGELIGPNDFDSNFMNLLFVFSRLYEFSYDISYPVVVELRDPNAFNQEGYSFMFALESNTRNNVQLKPGEIMTVDKFGVQKESLMMDAIVRISGNITIVARDQDAKLMQGASVRYTCGPDSIYIGKTNEKGRLVTNLPVCIGGTLTALKEGYIGGNKELSTAVAENGFAELMLNKIYKKKATLLIRQKQDLDSVADIPYGSLTQDQLLSKIGESTREINENETVYLTLQKISGPEEVAFSRAYIFDNDNKNWEVELAEGTFDVYAQIVDSGGVQIPKQTLVISNDGNIVDKVNEKLLGTSDTKEVEIPAVNITPAMRGGAILNNVTGYWYAAKEDLVKQNSLRFYAIKNTLPRRVDEISKAGNELGVSIDMRSFIEPEWIRE